MALLLNVVILFILFCIHGANGDLLHQPEHPEDHSLFDRLTSGQTSNIGSFKPDDGSDDVVNYAVYKSYSRDSKHYGVMATMDVYGFAISKDQESAAALWVGNPGNGTQTTQNFIFVGWHVKPSLYSGDSSTRFFTYWTSDGFQMTGCYNMACPGFQLQPGSRVSPGDVINPVSQIYGPKQNITLKVYKEDDTGDWWVYYGFNSSPTEVGHFPKSLFIGLETSTVDFAFGGYVSNARTQTTPPMGSGTSQIGAASFSDLQYILQDGTGSEVSGDLPSRVDNRNCYPITPIVDSKFFYGGPSGCPIKS